MTNTPPLVLAAFGTTARAMNTYSYIDAQVKKAFPGHPRPWIVAKSGTDRVKPGRYRGGQTPLKISHLIDTPRVYS
jgi:hypothetical protein